MNLKDYQRSAIDNLFNNIIDQLNEVGVRRKIVFQAPTGAGKTVMATETMRRLVLELSSEDCQYNQAAFIWLAPNALHIQSYLTMKNAFSESKILEPVVYDELDLGYDGYIKPGQVFFVNWQSINKEKNVMVRGSEQTSSIYDIIDRTKQQNIAVICIIDEEHMFGGSNANKSEKVLERIQPKVEVRISATPVTIGEAAKVTVSRQKVISAGMIKQNISLNPALRNALARADDQKLNTVLLSEALKKRNEIAKAYKKLGVNINPLLLIQLPNDDTDSLSREENELKELLINTLSSSYDISRDNGKMAVWLADEKTNLDGIENRNSIVNVLLFKQAIALGWDCPRAAVLLIYRKLSSFTFTIQTVGRIMRMPEQHFYGNSLLDIGFVYTDLSADMIRIDPDDAHYINTLHSYLRPETNNVLLSSEKEERTNRENNVLRSDFRKLFNNTMSEEWLESTNAEIPLFDDEVKLDDYAEEYEKNRMLARKNKHIEFEVSRIQIEIPVDMELRDEVGEYLIQEKTGYARTMDELEQVFEKYCSSRLNGWSKSKAIPVLVNTIVDTMELFFNLNEWDTIKVVMCKQNNEKFSAFIDKVLKIYKEKYLTKVVGSKLGFIPTEWTLPAERIYNDLTNHEEEDVRNHAIMPFIEANNASTPENNFRDYLESKSSYIDWWYKNGDSGAEHLAVRYIHSDGKPHLFFVDFVIRMKNGTICLFDTKSTGGDPEAVNKHNALIDYLKIESEKRKLKLVGGIIIEDRGIWKYSPMHISNARDVSGWNSFFPDEYKA